MASEERPASGLSTRHLPYGLVSLWDVINYQLVMFYHVIRSLVTEERDGAVSLAVLDILNKNPSLKNALVSLKGGANPSDVVPPEFKARMGDILLLAKEESESLHLDVVGHRVRLFKEKLSYMTKLGDYIAEIRALRETIEAYLVKRFLYHYPPEKAAILQKFETDWSKAIKEFPSIKEEALAGVDCYALGHSTASVFHMMRCAEIGLRALARKLKVKIPRKPLAWAEWQDIIAGIRKKVEPIAGRRRGPARDAALEFYRGALAGC